MLYDIIDVFISGLTNGSVFALMAVGMTLVYGVSKAFNFAYGSFFVLGGYIAWSLFGLGVGNYFWVFIIAIPLLFVFGYLAERAIVAPLRKRDDWEVTVMMITLGLAMLMDNTYIVSFGPRMKSIPSLLEGSFEFGEIVITYQDSMIFCLSITIMLIFLWFLSSTRIGMSVRAVSQNPTGAQIVGIPKEFIFSATFAISTVLVGLSGILLSQKYFVNPNGGWTIMVKAWVITAFGGMGSIKGALYAAFILGMLDAFVGYFFGMNWILMAMISVLILTLAVRPQGISGE